MFRPSPETVLFHKVPLRLIAAVLLIVALAVSVLLLFSLQHEELLVQGLAEGKSTTGLFGLWHARHDLVVISVLLFLLSAIGITAVITFQHDTTTRRTLEAVKGLARNILESIPTGILTVNQAGEVTAVNPSAVATLRRSTEELLGRPYDQIFAEGAMMRLVLDGALRHHRHLEQQDLSYTAGGEAARIIRVTTADLTGDEGQATGVLVLLKDVTALLELERRVRVADKLAGLHTLSAGVAHELRNPLSAIDLNLHLLEEELRGNSALPAVQDKYLRVLNAETRRLSSILDNFMKFARPGSVPLNTIDTHRLVSHIVSLLQYEAQDRQIRLLTNEQEPLPSLIGDETELSQVLVNVLVNAFQAMPQGGECRVTVRGVDSGPTVWVELTVQDSGVGIRAEDLSRLFEPFYTTKTGGSGLGLAIAYRIVQDHQGTISVTSHPGAGTTVVLRLPAVAAAPGALVPGQ